MAKYDLWHLFSQGSWIWIAGEVWCLQQAFNVIQVQDRWWWFYSCQLHCALWAKEELVCTDSPWELIIQTNSGVAFWPVAVGNDVTGHKELPPKDRLGKKIKWNWLFLRCFCSRKNDRLAIGRWPSSRQWKVDHRVRPKSGIRHLDNQNMFWESFNHEKENASLCLQQN